MLYHKQVAPVKIEEEIIIEPEKKEKKIEPIKETVHSDKLYDLMAESAKRQEEILKAIQELKGVPASGVKKEQEVKPNEKSPEQLAMEKKLLEDEKK